MVYRFEKEALEWASGAHIPKGADLKLTSEALMRLRAKDGYLLPDNITDAAEEDPEGPAWKPFFEADSELAVRRYHEIQARELLRSFVIVKMGGQDIGPTRAFVIVTLPNGQRSYEPTPVAIKQPDQKAELIEQVEREKKSFDDKLSELIALIKLL